MASWRDRTETNQGTLLANLLFDSKSGLGNATVVHKLLQVQVLLQRPTWDLVLPLEFPGRFQKVAMKAADNQHCTGGQCVVDLSS